MSVTRLPDSSQQNKTAKSVTFKFHGMTGYKEKALVNNPIGPNRLCGADFESVIGFEASCC